MSDSATFKKSPLATTLHLSASSRLDMQNVSQALAKVDRDSFSSFRNIAVSSLHTTAGFLEQPLAAKLRNSPEGIGHLVRSIKRLFPEGAPYWHDRMELRNELTEEQRKSEPLNADSHLAFICLGLCNSVLYTFDPEDPIYFIDLDGESRGTFRSRKVLVTGYNDMECVHEEILSIAVPEQDRCALDLSENLSNLQVLANKHKIPQGLLTLELESDEKHAGITVNEFESLLVERDITDVLMNPLKYMLNNVSEFARRPLMLPRKAKKMLAYELRLAIRDGLKLAGRSVSAIEYIAERLHMRLPLLEYIIDRIASPLEARWMNLGSTARFLINADSDTAHGKIMVGTYQSPILIQWRRPESDVRRVRARLFRLT